MGYGYIERAGLSCAAETCDQNFGVPALLPDPLGEDSASDRRRALSDREIARVVFVAAEAGQRFGREGRSEDPAAWMYAPRRLFGGEAPVDACATRHGFVAAMLLHGIWPELDAEPAALEDLLTPDDSCPEPLPQVPLLFTALLTSDTPAGSRHAFYAVAACDEYEARMRLAYRIGIDAVKFADFQRGFDTGDPIGRLLLPEVVHNSLSRLSGRPAVPADLELLVDYRLAA